MRLSKTVTLLLSVLCAVLVFSVLAVPTVLVYSWLAPVGFWQKFSFSASLAVLCLFPFRRPAKREPANKVCARYKELRDEIIKDFFRSPSLRHREKNHEEMRAAAQRFGLRPKRQFDTGIN